MRTALITGSARGIGAATARRFAQAGYAVCISYRHAEEAARALAQELEARGGACIVVGADVASEAGVEHLFSAVDDAFGAPSVLVNNAATLETQTRLVDLDADRVNRILTNNVTSAFLCCREAVKRMSTAQGGAGGVIVNVSSVAARTGSPNEYVDYAASKGAVDTLTTGLAREVAAEGIRVNCVRPGLIHTELHAAGGEPGRVDRLAPAIPMQRGGTPEEIAEAIYWLASDASSYATGSFLDLAGGL